MTPQVITWIMLSLKIDFVLPLPPGSAGLWWLMQRWDVLQSSQTFSPDNLLECCCGIPPPMTLVRAAGWESNRSQTKVCQLFLNEFTSREWDEWHGMLVHYCRKATKNICGGSKYMTPKIHTYFPPFKYLVSGWKPNTFLFISTYVIKILRNLIAWIHPGKGQGVRRMLTHLASCPEERKASPCCSHRKSLHFFYYRKRSSVCGKYWEHMQQFLVSRHPDSYFKFAFSSGISRERRFTHPLLAVWFFLHAGRLLIKPKRPN